jgi:hypothetical protein
MKHRSENIHNLLAYHKSSCIFTHYFLSSWFSFEVLYEFEFSTLTFEKADTWRRELNFFLPQHENKLRFSNRCIKKEIKIENPNKLKRSIGAFWGKTPCDLIDQCQCVVGICCLHLHCKKWVSSEALVHMHRITLCHIPENKSFPILHREDLKYLHVVAEFL